MVGRGGASLLLLLPLLLAGARALECPALIADTQYTGCKVLTPGKAAVTWLWQQDTRSMDIRLVLNATRSAVKWCGFGFSDMGSMKGADLWIVHRDSRNRWAVTDTLAKDFATPVPDKVQDVTLRSMSFNATQQLWSAVLSRKLKTCDYDADIAIEPGRGVFLMWAHGQAFGRGFQGISYHGTESRGFLQVQMLDVPAKKLQQAAAEEQAALAAMPVVVAAAAATTPSPEEVEELAQRLGPQLPTYTNKQKCRDNSGPLICKSSPQLTAADNGVMAAAADDGTPATNTSGNSTGNASFIPDITDNGDGSFSMDVLCKVPVIPSKETTYMTCYVELPTDQEYKIVEYTTIFGHKKLVHHSLIYACLPELAQPKVEAMLRTSGAGPYDQSDYRMLCEAFYLVGPAPTDPTYRFPSDAGLVFGKGSYRYVAIEIHYNNPLGLVGESDPGTGLNVRFEPSARRPSAVGILTIGQFLMNLPPGQEAVYANRSVCSTACTSRFKQPVTMIGQFVHMHGAGRQLLTQRVRNNRQLEPLVTVRTFDYNYQTWLDIPDASNKLLPGDELSVQCVYSTKDRTKATTFGLSTSEEMCFHWIYYYPAQEGMGICSSLGDTSMTMCTSTVAELVDLQDAYDDGGGDSQTYKDAINSIIASGKAIVSRMLPADNKWDPNRGCSATKPK